MATVSIKQFAEVVGVTVERLLSQLTEAGLAFSKEEVITDEDKMRLLTHLRSKHDGLEVIPDVLIAIKKSDDLRELNGILTKVMSEQRTMGLIKGNNLNVIAKSIVELVNNSDTEHELFGAAMLGRLAAVARGRENSVFDHASEVFSERPVPMETLEDRDERFYSSLFLGNVNEAWLVDYCITEASATDLADKTRKELFKIILIRTGNVSEFLELLYDHTKQIQSLFDAEVRAKRARRVYKVLVEVINEWNGEFGINPGEAIDNSFICLMKGQMKDVDDEILFSIADSVLIILQKVISLRFSHAFDSETYKVISSCKRILGNRNWSYYLSQSKIINNVRIFLLEAVVVLAKQSRTDSDFISLLSHMYGGKSKVGLPVSKHFEEHPDIDAETRDWWIKAGEVKTAKRKSEHKMSGSEDQQIGALMIEVDNIKDAMKKLERAVIPFVEIQDPVLAATVKKSVAGYASISRISRQLGEMRKLVTTNLKGERMEYNPQQHEMLGGHKPGVRKIKVVRDGVQKNFEGNIKTLVKCWVEPQE